MSGAIFAPLEGPGAPDPASSHPLVCPLCHVQYERLCLLDCFHDFCAGCLRGRAVDGRLAYPLCRHQTEVKDPSGLPPGDRLLQFLVDSSGHGVEAVHCANCDLECSKQTAETVYFCNACGQPLCARCRDDTHRARMFASHDIVALGQRSHDVIQKCTLHAEPYILFSTDTKSLLCIRCFRDLQGDAWAHCVDLESAYVQGFERLEQAMRHPVQAVKALQTATREAIALLQALVQEVRHSAEEEEAAIHALFGSMQDTLAKREALLLQTVQSQYKEKDKACKEQLCHLATLLPTQQVHPVICSSFLSLANKAEFLDLAHELMGRLQGIFTRPHRLRPEQSSKIASHHRTEFARCLEPLLWPGPRRAGGGAYTLAGGSGLKELPGPSCPLPEEKMSGLPVSKPTPLAEVGDRPFTEHGRRYEDSYRGLQGALQSLKDQVQELPRDLTKHHALIKAEIMGGILGPALELDGRIAWEYACTAGLRAGFREIWEESYQPAAREQEIYEAQLQGLLRLRRENACLTTITRQITPYVRSIAKVKERLEPRFQAPGDKLSENLSLYDDKNGKALAKSDPGNTADKREKAKHRPPAASRKRLWRRSAVIAGPSRRVGVASPPGEGA
ncbi:LOW QUALITY PROTEIN: RING finger protein 207 [Heterocephalus glaber]|uniref:RING finger protein 207 n=1 Tax=Heterocephalus glaber TaxID=10181 RepID=A0AAX6Q2H4_HETGA|nr:LOW QUALITY PROTEIN: RING finger protein 207 [Heterocephalus glaber]